MCFWWRTLDKSPALIVCRVSVYFRETDTQPPRKPICLGLPVGRNSPLYFPKFRTRTPWQPSSDTILYPLDDNCRFLLRLILLRPGKSEALYRSAAASATPWLGNGEGEWSWSVESSGRLAAAALPAPRPPLTACRFSLLRLGVHARLRGSECYFLQPTLREHPPPPPIKFRRRFSLFRWSSLALALTTDAPNAKTVFVFQHIQKEKHPI